MKRFFLAAVFVCIFVRPVLGATLNVPSQYPTIQAAVDASLVGDTVSVAPGTYSGNGNCDIMLSKPITVISQSGPGETIIDCQNNGNGIFIDADILCPYGSSPNPACEFRVSGFTIQNASTGIYANGPFPFDEEEPDFLSLMITDCVLRSNQIGIGNTLNIFSHISNCTLSGNDTAISSTAWSLATIENSTVSNNEVGIEVDESYVRVNRCIITRNSINGCYTAFDGALFLYNSIVSWNSGIGVYSGTHGGYNIQNSTMYGNNGGIFNGYMSGGAITNSIIRNNGPYEIENDADYPTPIRIKHSNLKGGISQLVESGTAIDEGGNINLIANFVDPDGADNIMGTDDDDFHLMANSGCIDKGTSEVFDLLTQTDIDGDDRFIGLAPDIGADEFEFEYEFFRDSDSDGYGVSTDSIIASIRPSGYADESGDCDDNDAAVNPGAIEACNGVDDDCNGIVDEGVKIKFFRDADGDGFGNPEIEITSCTQPDGYIIDNTDCKDNDNKIFPGAAEIENDIDDNCNGQIDEGISNTPIEPADETDNGGGGGSGGGCFILSTMN